MPAAIATYCLPPTEYVIGPAETWPPRFAFHKSAPLAGIQRKEISFAPAGEQQVRRGREQAAVGDVGHLELPLPGAGLRIERLNGAVPVFGQPPVDHGTRLQHADGHHRQRARESPAFRELDRPLDVRRGRVHPARNVEESVRGLYDGDIQLVPP